MLKKIIFLFLVFSMNSVYSQNFLGTKFKYAKIYLYNKDNNLLQNYQIIKNGKLDTTVTDTGVVLNIEQLNKITEISKQDFCDLIPGLSKTHLPHHGIVFYNKKGKPTAWISIGFEGETLRMYPKPKCKDNFQEFSSKKIIYLEQKLKILKDIFVKSGYPVLKSPFDYNKIEENKNR